MVIHCLGCSSTLFPEKLLIPQVHFPEARAKLGLFENRSQKRPGCCLGKLDHEFYRMVLIPLIHPMTVHPWLPYLLYVRGYSKSQGCTCIKRHQETWVYIYSTGGDRQQKCKQINDKDYPHGGKYHKNNKMAWWAREVYDTILGWVIGKQKFFCPQKFHAFLIPAFNTSTLWSNCFVLRDNKDILIPAKKPDI